MMWLMATAMSCELVPTQTILLSSGAVDVASGQITEDLTVPKPSGFKLAWYAVIALLGLRRSNVGGFGSAIPEQTSSGGYG